MRHFLFFKDIYDHLGGLSVQESFFIWFKLQQFHFLVAQRVIIAQTQTMITSFCCT